jgi:hypothetical protein
MASTASMEGSVSVRRLMPPTEAAAEAAQVCNGGFDMMRPRMSCCTSQWPCQTTSMT